MRLLFFHKTILETRQSLTDVFANLQYHVQQEKSQGIIPKKLKSHHTYTGNYNNHSFRIRKIIGYRNDFRPLLHGKYYTSGNKTRIDIYFQLHPIVYIAPAFSIILFIYGIYNTIFIYIPENKAQIHQILILAFAIYTIVCIFFNFELHRAKKDMLHIFEAEEVNVH
jgi:hypothetical protein